MPEDFADAISASEALFAGAGADFVAAFFAGAGLLPAAGEDAGAAAGAGVVLVAAAGGGVEVVGADEALDAEPDGAGEAFALAFLLRFDDVLLASAAGAALLDAVASALDFFAVAASLDALE